jgi:hypothetical protein
LTPSFPIQFLDVAPKLPSFLPSFLSFSFIYFLLLLSLSRLYFSSSSRFVFVIKSLFISRNISRVCISSSTNQLLPNWRQEDKNNDSRSFFTRPESASLVTTVPSLSSKNSTSSVIVIIK